MWTAHCLGPSSGAAVTGYSSCRLFEYFAIITLINQVGITVFRAIAAIGRAVVLCNVLAFVYIAYALLLCGFIIPLGTPPSFCSLHVSASSHSLHPVLLSLCWPSFACCRPAL